MERRLAAILAADVVGFSRLMGEDEAGTLEALKALRKDVVAPAIASHKGRVVKVMGDGLLAEFASVVEAVACAVAVQAGVRERNASAADQREILLRIGVNLGDVIVEGRDIYGDGVNVAARLEALAEPGSICISDTVHQSIRAKLDLSFDDLGLQTVKNIAQPIHAYLITDDTGKNDGQAGRDEPLALPEKPSIAVLPFDNMSGDQDQEFFADGMSEDLITALSRIRWLFVIARNSTFTYKGQAVEVKQVARDLGVRYVLEGSVRKAGSRMRVTAQLIDATTGHHVWAERYDRQVDGIFELQDEMTQTIVGAVEPELSAAERDRVLSKPPDNLDAWESYQRAVWHMWRYAEDDCAKSLSFFDRAIGLDPNFAPAYAYKTYSLYQTVIMGWSQDNAASLAEGLVSAERALQIDDQDSVAFFAVGRIYMMQGKHDASIDALEKAIALNPSFAHGYHGLGMSLTLAGRLDEAKQALEYSERLSPRDPILWASTIVHALANVLSGDYEEGVRWAMATVRNPRSTGYWPHAVLAAALAHSGRLDEARESVHLAVQELPDLTLSYLKTTLPTKQPDGLDPYLDGLRMAGLPE